MTDVLIETPSTVSESDQRSYVDWPAIFAGTVVASAISAVLLTFGAAIGLSLTSAYEGEGISLTAFAIAAALWVVWVQVSGFLAGGYLTGRVRRRHHDATEDESDIRDGIHGLAVWGVGVLVGAAIAYAGVAGIASSATTAAQPLLAALPQPPPRQRMTSPVRPTSMWTDCSGVIRRSRATRLTQALRCGGY